ncbi:succinate dehydrogenase assembly factor 2 [Aliikangiella coralliicola]|uniref:FAD assembly factor SdhE n=1 Tax=Aliikangiella coralliicola TaxID=2592383 RepID=A0A545U694_9GAMM|nr:succinate dehydrogenase assembly factor 2 [Aliikangiella coralliicola]TQV84995.1 succinate dehydrogenase assembly factor 2 [Aliikangiella coralliicola]
MKDTSEKKKLTWQCRRGMLELDVILSPFLQQHFDSLSVEQQTIFADLLNEADPDLYTWLMGYGTCDDPRLDQIIQLIRVKMQISQ